MTVRLRLGYLLQFACLWLCILGIRSFNASSEVKPNFSVNTMSKLVWDARVDAFDKLGKRKYHILANKAYMATETSPVEFEQPKVDIFEEKKIIWRISAKEAVMDSKATWVRFQKEAKAIEHPAEDPVKTEAEGDYFDYLPKSKWIETKALVHIIKPGMRIASKGLQANLKTRKIMLMEQSQVVFDNIKERQP